MGEAGARELTGFENQRVPPISNQQRWPPSEVLTMAVCGFAWNSAYGTALSTAICEGGQQPLQSCSGCSGTHGVVGGVNGQEGDPDGQDGVG